MRLTVRRFIDVLAGAPTVDDLRRNDPELAAEDIHQALKLT
jgi:hypothetical protein